MSAINAEEIRKNAIKQQNEKKTTAAISNVYFEYGAYLKILRFSKAGSIDGSRGLLLGYKEGENVYITAALEALYSGDDGLESPSFTKESWSRIQTEKKEYYENLLVIGQYATHPKNTPTSDDESMQKAFFKENENILFVFDPIDNTESVNIYADGMFKKLDGIFLYDKTGANVDISIKQSITRTVDTEYEHRMRALKQFSKQLSKRTSQMAIALLVLVLFIVYLLFQNAELNRKVTENEQSISELNTRCEQLEARVWEQSLEIEAIKETLYPPTEEQIEE